MRQLTLGVQLKERATFASFHTARNQELVAHLRHVAQRTPPAPPGWPGRIPRASRTCCRRCARRWRRAGAPPIYRSRPCCRSVRRRWMGAEVARRGLLRRRAGDRGAGCLGAAPVLAVAARRSSATRRCCSPRARIPRTWISGWRISSRGLASSAVFAVRELNDDEQLEALALRARLRGLEMPPETARYLQRRFPRDMRTLCEILDTLDDAAFVAQRRLTVPFIRDVIDGRAPR